MRFFSSAGLETLSREGPWCNDRRGHALQCGECSWFYRRAHGSLVAHLYRG